MGGGVLMISVVRQQISSVRTICNGAKQSEDVPNANKDTMIPNSAQVADLLRLWHVNFISFFLLFSFPLRGKPGGFVSELPASEHTHIHRKRYDTCQICVCI